MPDLGKYAEAVLSAWGISILLVVALIALSWRQSVAARRALDAAEARQSRKGK
jgi:heme exporter protein D